MKKLLLLLAIILSTVSYAQLTDANFQQVVDDWISDPNSAQFIDTNNTPYYGLISDWDVSQVTNMSNAFENKTDFNGDISSWDTTNVTNMSAMFGFATAFNQPLNDWDTSKVENMSVMFYRASVFNQPLNDWDTGNVINMSYMFDNATTFNQPLNDWEVGNVTNMYAMFGFATAFNQPLNDWDTGNVINMSDMFNNATTFNQPLNDWEVGNVTYMDNMFDNSGLSTDNYDGVLNSWSELGMQSNVTLGAQQINYCNGADARQSLIDNYGWIITDGELDCSTAGVDDQNQLDISIYPNPTSDIVYIDGNYTQLKVIIYNVLGKEILNKSITNSIDISHLDNGVYILQLSDGVKLITRKIIKN